MNKKALAVMVGLWVLVIGIIALIAYHPVILLFVFASIAMGAVLLWISTGLYAIAEAIVEIIDED